jgi:hypothetical protein
MAATLKLPIVIWWSLWVGMASCGAGTNEGDWYGDRRVLPTRRADV